MTIGDKIKARRKELGLSVEELAKKIGKNKATVYRYENNEIEKLPTNILEPIASALYTNPAYLTGWDDNDSKDTIAAHFDGDEFSAEELDEIRQFAEFIKNKRKSQ